VKPRLLVLCTGNSARSQMAEGLFRREVGDRFDVFSAGTKPGFVRPEAIAVMAEIGIDISTQRSKSVDEFLGREFRYIVTVCDNARENCPVFPATTARIHWSLDDPAAMEGSEEARLAAFRKIRDELVERITEVARQLSGRRERY
jgi:arsenate reductase